MKRAQAGWLSGHSGDKTLPGDAGATRFQLQSARRATGGGRGRTLKLACLRLADVKLARLKSCGVPGATRAGMSHLGSVAWAQFARSICQNLHPRPDSDARSRLLVLLPLAVAPPSTMQVRTT